ncbi:GBF-interacting protein 1 [Lactuca sativa]|uniref:GBF-interacting protein 1 n=1 Tax=Lactuca sativa TaxID=4236 RepID=UPI000CD7F294|nr:GBF-interacting protein 1 [Lactuca sativa]
MSGGGVTRVSIPHNARKVIQEIKKTIGSKHSDEFVYTTLKDCDMDPKEASRRLKMIHDIIEIAGKHNVEDVYTMLKDCNMDPNEAAQRLLYIDTFHEVKKKHDRRKSISSDTSEDYKRTQGNQWRRNLSSGKEYGVTNRQERVSRLIIPVDSVKVNNGAHVANSVANGNGTLVVSNGSYSDKLAPESSSTSDTVVVSSKNTCAVGTIQCEIVKRSGSTKSNSRLPAGTGIKVSADSIPVVVEPADSDNARQLKSDVVEGIEISESLKPLSLSAVNPSQDNQPPQSLHEPVKVNGCWIPEEKPELKVSGDVGVEKSSYQAVIFPDHLQVPENLKSQFTFGSLDVVQEASSLKSSHPDSALKHDETKKVEVEVEVEMMPPLGLGGGFQNPIVQRDYSFGYMPHLMGPGPHFLHVDVPELQSQSGSGGSVVTSGIGQTPATQSATVGAAQNPISLSPPPPPPPPPVFPYFRQVFPSYVPYNPYFPHFYIPQNAHLFNHAHAHAHAHGVFPTHQPPPTSTPVPAAATGIKFPVPQLKQGSNDDDVTVSQSQQKDNNLLQQIQGEVWGREVVPNYFYNFVPQAQGHGPIYQYQYQSASTCNVQPVIVPVPLMYQSQSTTTAAATNTIEPSP